MMIFRYADADVIGFSSHAATPFTLIVIAADYFLSHFRCR